jgi:hypothetical protein
MIITYFVKAININIIVPRKTVFNVCLCQGVQQGWSYSSLSPHNKQLVLAIIYVLNCSLGTKLFIYSLMLTAGPWFSPGTLGTKNKTDRRDITEILLKVALSAMTIILSFLSWLLFFYETNWDMNYNLFSPLEWWSRQIS